MYSYNVLFTCYTFVPITESRPDQLKFRGAHNSETKKTGQITFNQTTYIVQSKLPRKAVRHFKHIQNHF
jgi:hypothetical protein